MIATRTLNNAHVLEIAKRQRTILWLIAFSIIVPLVVTAASPYIGLREAAATAVNVVAQVIFSFVAAVYVYKFARSLQCGATKRWAYTIATIIPIPLYGIIPLALINRKANAVLRSHQIRVGLMGVRNEDLSKLRRG